MTSSDIINKTKKIIKFNKIGHSGTLDKNASGVLILGLGNSTKLLPYLWKYKEYATIVKFGMQTDTLDRDGKCIEMNAVNYLEYKGIGHILSQYFI